jgi:hypothetical protein
METVQEWKIGERSEYNIGCDMRSRGESGVREVASRMSR